MNGTQENQTLGCAQSVIVPIGISKNCTKCGIKKPMDDFPPNRHMKSGKQAHCRKCCNEFANFYRAKNGNKLKEQKKRSYDANPEKYREASRKFRREHPDRVAASLREWRKKNPDKINSLSKKWRDKNIPKIRGYYKNYYENNKEKIFKHTKEWSTNNREKINIGARIRAKKQRETLMGNLNNRISIGICSCLQQGKGGWHWENLVGFTLVELKEHLEKQFKNGMGWENREKWEIDHKIPKSAFNFSCAEDIDFKKCWALSNLQPLWRSTNRSKHDHLLRPFQPSLAMG